MSALTYPSPEFPGTPGVRLEVPEDWTAVPTPGALLATRGPLTDGVASTIVVRHSTRPLTFTVAAALDDLRTYAAGQPDGEIDEPFQLELAGTSFVGVNLSWVDPNAGPMVQVHLLAGHRAAGLVHLVHVTGAVGGDDVESDYTALQSILQTLVVEP